MLTSERWVQGAAWVAYLGLLVWLGNLGGAWAEWRKDTNLAAWVQAVGSVGAIAAGAAAVWWQIETQRRQAERQRVAEEVRRLRLLWMLVYQCRAMMAIAEAMAGKGSFRLALPMKHAIGALREVNILDVPDASTATSIVQAIQTYDFFEEFGAPLASAGPERVKEYTEHVQVARANLEATEQALRKRLLARGADIEPGASVSVGGRSYPPLAPDEPTTRPQVSELDLL